MKKRKPFFVKGNFQLKFIVCFVLVLAIEVLLALLIIYHNLATIIEKAAFSSHISLGSSGELFWQSILKINLIVCCLSLFIGLLIIWGMYCYLQVSFHSLAEGMERLGKGDFSYRMQIKKHSRRLSKDFNDVVLNLDKSASEAEKLIILSLKDIEALRSTEAAKILEIKALQNRLRRIS